MSSVAGVESSNRSRAAEVSSAGIAPHPRQLLRPGLLSWSNAALLLLLTALFTLLVVQASLRHGRLMFYPQPDDPTYLLDGLERLQIFDKGGLLALGGNLLRDPPRSPFSSLLAAGSFLIFGTHSWAPYAGNAIVLAFLLLVVHLFVAQRTALERTFAYLFALTFPIAVNSIHEFRPDIANCLVAACAMMFCLPLAAEELPRRELAVIGALTGMAVLTKPTFAPYTLFLVAFAAASASLMRKQAGWSERFRSMLRAEAWILLIAAAIAGPYILWSWSYFTQYIYDNSFGVNRELWSLHEGLVGQMRYFINGVGGSMMLGRHLWVALPILMAGMAFLLAGPGRNHRKPFLLILLWTLVAYAIPTINVVKNGFSAGVFFFLILFACLYVLTIVPWRSRLPGLALALLAGVVAFQFRQEWGKMRPRVEARNRLVETTRDIVRRHAVSLIAAGEDRRFFVFLSTFGAAHNYATISYLLLLDGVDNVKFIDLHRTTDPSSYRLALEQADIVVANTAGGEEATGFLPSSQMADQTLASVRDDQRFAYIRTFRLLDGSRYFYFEKKDLKHAAPDLGGVELAANPAPVCARQRAAAQ